MVFILRSLPNEHLRSHYTFVSGLRIVQSKRFSPEKETSAESLLFATGDACGLVYQLRSRLVPGHVDCGLSAMRRICHGVPVHDLWRPLWRLLAACGA